MRLDWSTGDSQFLGLSEEEAARRLADEGPNELPSAKKRGLFHIALEVIREPMFMLLIACGSLYLLLGDVKEALLLLGFVFVVAGHYLFSGAQNRAGAGSSAGPLKPARACHSFGRKETDCRT